MGNFLAVTAIKSNLQNVSDVIKSYMTENKTTCKAIELHSNAQPNERTDALCFDNINDWVVVLWPVYFNVHDFPAAKFLSSQLATIVSTVNVYDDECWSHGLFENGNELDRYCSIPELMDEDNPTQAMREWSGNCKLVSEKFNVPEELVSQYFVNIDNLSEEQQSSRIFPDDEFEIGDFWVFVDFWKHVGIVYPDVSKFDICFRLDKNFTDKLPYNE